MFSVKNLLIYNCCFLMFRLQCDKRWGGVWNFYTSTKFRQHFLCDDLCWERIVSRWKVNLCGSKVCHNQDSQIDTSKLSMLMTIIEMYYILMILWLRQVIITGVSSIYYDSRLLFWVCFNHLMTFQAVFVLFPSVYIPSECLVASDQGNFYLWTPGQR